MKQYPLKILILKEDSGYDGNISLIADDPESPVDVMQVWKEDRPYNDEEEIKELVDSGYLNWDSQMVQIPECIVRQIQSDAFSETPNSELLAELERRGARITI